MEIVMCIFDLTLMKELGTCQLQTQGTMRVSVPKISEAKTNVMTLIGIVRLIKHIEPVPKFEYI